ncbi:hypothetical protein [Mycobacteroides abscessus]|uniref:hypothetical protein n=1 Tax=Mycobacteroides abscessus TaxID=36809 RepID=UPI0005E79E7B|nr:hypothetical protein [Mycobacteroides abscessus]CPR79231.1 Uncharacterised protein [Mycobacteroides abscessus]CPR88384.1 Uncharacterised protein [Mycobacteroides abscessus]CPS43318.1 Uncharacterised protein [Mycobacteroides abscessus]CPV03122.1 Uncharacterised protein [Mycobacteroides abscessus]
MAKEPSFKLNKRGIAKLAKSAEAQAVVSNVAKRIAEKSGHEADVVEYTTDRAVAAVRVHAFDQAADGVLSRGASSAGIQINTSQTG